MRNTKLIITAAITLMLSNPWQIVKADRSKERQLKAAYLYNLSKFVTWKAKQPKAFTICVLASGIDGHIQALSGRRVKGLKVVVKQSKQLKNLNNCQIIYAVEPSKKTMASVIAQTKNRPILSLDDSLDFVKMGGNMSFIKEDNRLKIIVNQPTLKTSKISISSRLKSLITILK